MMVTIDDFLAGLRKHESGGRNVPNAGGHSSASGFYQYTDGTWNGYGGYQRAMDAPFEVQHQRALEDAQRSFRKHGGDYERMAMEHFYPAWADEPKSTWNRTPAPGNPTASEFVGSVMSNVGGGQRSELPSGAHSNMPVLRPDGEWGREDVGRAGQRLADMFGLEVTSHHRTPEKNRSVGGASNSDHLWGGGVDLAGDRQAMRELVDWAEQRTGENGPLRTVLHPWNDDAHDDHAHLSWERGNSQPLRLASLDGQPGTGGNPPGGPRGGQQGHGGGHQGQVPDYPSTPAPLDRNQIREFSSRRRAASRALDEALAERSHGSQRAEQKFNRLRSDLDLQAERRERDERERLGSMGMARQPRGLGRAMRELRDDKSAALTEGRESKADRLASLDFAVSQARSQRDQELADIRADKASARTGLGDLLGGGQ